MHVVICRASLTENISSRGCASYCLRAQEWETAVHPEGRVGCTVILVKGDALFKYSLFVCLFLPILELVARLLSRNLLHVRVINLE